MSKDYEEFMSSQKTKEKGANSNIARQHEKLLEHEGPGQRAKRKERRDTETQ